MERLLWWINIPCLEAVVYMLNLIQQAKHIKIENHDWPWRCLWFTYSSQLMLYIIHFIPTYQNINLDQESWFLWCGFFEASKASFRKHSLTIRFNFTIIASEGDITAHCVRFLFIFMFSSYKAALCWFLSQRNHK